LSMSFEKFTLDTDLCAAFHTYLRGFDVNDDSLGLEALREGGPGEHMFGTAHTLAHYRTAYWESGINDDQPYESWQEQGREDAMQRANRQWKKTLQDYKAPDLDEATDEALKEFVGRRKAEMDDSWY